MTIAVTMLKFIKPKRVAEAIKALEAWRMRAKSQPAMHLWPLLSIIRGKVSKNDFSRFTESDEFEFWDTFFRLPGDLRPGKDQINNEFTQDYYVEPLVLALKPADYPHRSPWTIRARTFLASWKAARSDDNHENWKMSPDFADIFVDKVLTKGDDVHRVPGLDLAIWLFRERDFPDGATTDDLRRNFAEEFKFDAPDAASIFEFGNEDAASVFTDAKPTHAELSEAIKSALLHQVPLLPADVDVIPDVPPEEEKNPVEDDDAIYVEVRRLLEYGCSGIIFRGCPGTSKTWYAKHIGRHLVTDSSHIFKCQFHPSYGYEDFVEGFRPDAAAASGFKIVDKVFLEACDLATRTRGRVVFIIDEINRGDPARVFGELLTYIERDYRGDTFHKTYTGAPASIPSNLVVFGTMNQYDKSITQFDLALTRRFAQIDLTPRSDKVEEFLLASGAFAPEQIDRISKWFTGLQRLLQQAGGIGHTYFKDVKSHSDLRTVWDYWMRPYCEAVLELDAPRLNDVKSSFDGMFKAVTQQGGQA